MKMGKNNISKNIEKGVKEGGTGGIIAIIAAYIAMKLRKQGIDIDEMHVLGAVVLAMSMTRAFFNWIKHR